MKKAMTALLAALWMAGAAATGAAQNGVIGTLVGTVELKPAGAPAFAPARDGDEVAPDTVVFTGFKSSATLTVGSAFILVRPLTRLTLTEISASQGKEQVNINLKAGRVRVDVKPPSGAQAEFKVVTPSATASVRGTAFDLDTRNLTVREGTVVYQGVRGAPAVVYAGVSTHADAASGKVGDPVVAAAAELVPPLPTSGPAGGAVAGGPTQTGPERDAGVFSIDMDLQF